MKKITVWEIENNLEMCEHFKYIHILESEVDF